MITLLVQPAKMKRVLFTYWLTVPLLFGLYLFILAAVKQVSVTTIFKMIPSLTVTTIVILLLFFQLFILYLLNDSSKYRGSLLGFFLRFSLIQQLLTFNVIGVLICILFYRSLLNAKDENVISKQLKWVTYGMIIFVGIITALIVMIRFTL